MIPGYDADIPMGFWKRTLQYHVPVKWLAVWFGLAVCQVAWGIVSLPVWWVWSLAGGLGLVIGELGCLQWLTWADEQWDSLCWNRDCQYYEAD